MRHPYVSEENFPLPLLLFLSHLFRQILELQVAPQTFDDNWCLCFGRRWMHIWFECTFLEFFHLSLHPEFLQTLGFFLPVAEKASLDDIGNICFCSDYSKYQTRLTLLPNFLSFLSSSVLDNQSLEKESTFIL